MDRRDFLHVLTSLTWSAAAAAPAAQPGSEKALTVSDFFRNDDFFGISVSPDGKTLAGIVPIGTRRNVAIVDLATRKAAAITAIRDRDVRSVRWINNDRLAYDLIDLQSGLGEQQPSGLFALNKDGSHVIQIASPSINAPHSLNFVYRFTVFLSVIPDSDDILALSNERVLDSTDVYRIDTKTGRRTLLTFSRPSRVFAWVLDVARVPRIALQAVERSTRVAIHYRASAEAEWKKIAEFDTLANEGFEPLAFGPDDTLYVASRSGSDHAGIFTYDLKANKLGERLASHKDFDFAYGNAPFLEGDAFGFANRNRNLIFDSAQKKLVGFRIFTEREEFYWLDDRWAQMYAMVEKALPGRVNRLSRPTDQGSVLVFSYSDREPGRWYLLDPEKRTLEELLSRRLSIRPEQQSERRFIRYAARDGRQIPAYLTLPLGRPARNLPLVVLVHGGPFVRGEFWGWDAEAEFLASRGYAVLQPDYRGSLGYGWQHYASGRRQWGAAMQDDLTDGVRALVAEGKVDAGRVAIMGGSYGGYATMMGLAKDPELYRCGIDIAGVTDLELMATATWSDMSVERPEFQHWFAAHVGDPESERSRLRATSPALLAGQIKRPVLIAHGGYDRRVPIAHATKMRAALQEANVPCDWVVYDEEAHGFLREANRIDLYSRIEAFLAKNMA